ncbi:MAG TPA: cellulose binding domain-containing protein [Pseudobacteroides sp.]|uniref:cellulose binding domain-containing protein n=1 Tax=Pseudobacteroides sp. TaxID=1968840 RepID=UPI002F958342
MFKSGFKRFSVILVTSVFLIFCISIGGNAYAAESKDVFKSAKTIKIGQNISAQLGEEGEKDYYAFTTKAAGTYIIRTIGVVDTYGILYDGNFKEIKENDEGDSGTSNFCIVSRLDQNKTYYVCVKGYYESDTGEYGISVVKSDLLIQSFNEYSENEIIANIIIFNVTRQPVRLSDIKVRYYYTQESGSKPIFKCDYASFGKGNVSGDFVDIKEKSDNADKYLELKFSGKSDVIESGLYAEVRVIISNTEQVKFNTENDWSVMNKVQEYTINNNVSGYLNGLLTWGAEPILRK